MNDDDWPDSTLENRRAMIRKTIRHATVAELEELGIQRFPLATDPWCEKYHEFLKHHPNEKFYRAETPEGAEIVYCRDSERGMWFLPDLGMGVIQPRGLKVMAEAVDAIEF
jgi:hypothetical protein